HQRHALGHLPRGGARRDPRHLEGHAARHPAEAQGVNPKASEFGPLQGLWLMLGYLLAQVLGNFLGYAAWGVGIGLDSALHHRPMPAHPAPNASVLAWATL